MRDGLKGKFGRSLWRYQRNAANSQEPHHLPTSSILAAGLLLAGGSDAMPRRVARDLDGEDAVPTSGRTVALSVTRFPMSTQRAPPTVRNSTGSSKAHAAPRFRVSPAQALLRAGSAPGSGRSMVRSAAGR